MGGPRALTYCLMNSLKILYALRNTRSTQPSTYVHSVITWSTQHRKAPCHYCKEDRPAHCRWPSSGKLQHHPCFIQVLGLSLHLCPNRWFLALLICTFQLWQEVSIVFHVPPTATVVLSRNGQSSQLGVGVADCTGHVVISKALEWCSGRVVMPWRLVATASDQQ